MKMTAKRYFGLLIYSLSALVLSTQAADLPEDSVLNAATTLDTNASSQVEVSILSREAPAGESQATENYEAPTVTGSVTPRLFLFDYFNGGNISYHTLERYGYQESLSGDTRSGVYPDVDINLTYGDQNRDLVTLERRGFGKHNHRGEASYSDDDIGVSGSYSHYRSATSGVDFYSVFGGGGNRGGLQGGR